MPRSPTPADPLQTRSPRGISSTDVDRVADELLRAGIRPTVLKIRERLGTGSPNTINPLLDAWWKRLASRLDSGPAALHRIPEAVAQITEALWLQALESARERAHAEERTTHGQLERDRRDVELRRHVLSLREAEFEDQLKDRKRAIATLEDQVAALTRLLQQEQAHRTSASRRIATLEAALQDADARTARLFGRMTARTMKSRRTPSAKSVASPQREKLSHRKKPQPSTRRGPTSRGKRRSR